MRKAIEVSIQAENEPLALISKKKNSDLKKMLARKVEKLNKKTERSIVSLLSKLILSVLSNYVFSRAEPGREAKGTEAQCS